MGSNPVEVPNFFRVNVQLLKLQLPLRRLYLYLNIQKKTKKNVAFAATHDQWVTLLGLPRL